MATYVIIFSVLLVTVFAETFTENNDPKDFFHIFISHTSTKDNVLQSGIRVSIEGAPKKEKYVPKIINNYGPNGDITSTSVWLARADTDYNQISKKQPSHFLDYEYHAGFGFYKFYRPASWREAFFICHSQGAHLAIGNSKEEMHLFTTIVNKHKQVPGLTYPNYILLGFHDLYKEDNFVTVDGQLLAEAGFSEFGANINYKPNGGTKENCGCFFTGNEALDDINCDVPAHFICEKEFE